MRLIKRFDDPTLDLDDGGGKALNLGLMTRAGFPVPTGFVVTTDAYRSMVTEAGLDAVIGGALADLGTDPEPAAADAASEVIRAAFRAAEMPFAVQAALDDALDDLGTDEQQAFAVRSSATAEDLPDLSFAGQQDTLLGVVGPDALREAVVECWSSLWTARAIVYRRRAGISEDAVALAVVVQTLIDSVVSGVLFTADPVTGHRGRMVLDATWGLGEALVSGQVVPDHWVADAASGRVTHRETGGKALTLTREGDRVVAHPTRAADQQRPCLTDAQITEVVALGRRVQAHYGTPQDIELATDAAGTLYLLQTRAITSLYPLPTGAEPGRLYFSFGSVQGLLAPMTPLGRDTIRLLFTGLGRIVGRDWDPSDPPILTEAGERLWVRVDGGLRHPLGRRLLPAFLGMIDPGARDAALAVAAEQDAPSGGLTLAWARGAGRFAKTVLPTARRVLAHPEKGRADFDTAAAEVVTRARAAMQAAGGADSPTARVRTRAAAMRTLLTDAFPTVLPWAAGHIPPSVLGLRLLTHLTEGEGSDGSSGHGVSARVLEVARAAPHNPTSDMDLALWRVTASVREHPAAAAVVRSLTAEHLAERYASRDLPDALQVPLADFLQRYGVRGVGEIDLGRRRWREDPTDILRTIRAGLDLPEEATPEVMTERGERAAEAAVADLRRQARGLRVGPVRERAVRAVARRVRALTGGREQPKWTIIQTFWPIREALLASGAELVDGGWLEAPDDIFLLRHHELESLTDAALPGLRSLVGERRAALTREARRTRVPRLLAGDGRAFHEGVRAASDAPEGAIVGSGVSPGVVEGVARVVHSPAESELQAGEILVCAGTDPAWTPLFLTAAGLVTEVGGMMTHGSVVAREYGIPAVVGVSEATTRLPSGTRVRLNGSTGTIEVLAPSAAGSDQPAVGAVDK